MERFLAWLALLWLTPSVWGDGMVMQATAVPAQVRIPDQRALIQFSNGVERLVIETRFTGAGTNFAWVVPMPSPPVIEEASAGLFPTLHYLFQPPLRHDVPHYFRLFLGLLAGGYLVRFVRRGSPVNVLDIWACLLLGLSVCGINLGGLLLFVFLVYAVESVRDLYRRRVDFLSVLLVIIFFVVLLLTLSSPASRSKSAGLATSSAPTVSILDRKVVGVFETTTISSRDPAALQDWLTSNGFAAPANRSQAIASYVRDGWVFVAAKIRRDDPALQTATPHPLSFTFKTSQAVYPMRLTGIDNGPMQADLYVFGSERAEAPHFKVERCTHPVYPACPQAPVQFDRVFVFNHYSSRRSEDLEIAHPLLRKWVEGSPVATKLTASLSQLDMRDDVWISWTPFAEKKTVLYSHEGAFLHAANWAAAAMAAFFLPAFAFGLKTWHLNKRMFGFVGGAVAASLVLMEAIYFLLPKTEVRMVLTRHTPVLETMENLSFIRESAMMETNLMEARAMISQGGWFQSMRNYLSGGSIHEEDSPGNYQLRQRGDQVQCIIYDDRGAAISE